MKRELTESEMWVLVAALMTLGGLLGGRWGTAGFVFLLCFTTRFVTLPLLTFIHELGHAAAAVRFTRRRALIQIGEEPYRVRFSIGRIDVDWSGRGEAAHCVPDRGVPITGRRLFLLVMAGPAASLIAGLGLGALAAWQWNLSSLLFWCLALGAGSSLYAAVGNTIPLRRWARWQGGVRWDSEEASDGWIAFQVLKDGLWSEVLPGVDESSPAMTAGVQRAIVAAGRAAGVGPVATDHLLTGLARGREGVASGVLRGCGFRPVADPPQAAEPPTAAQGFTPAAKRALNRAQAMLTLRGDQNIDTEHVLLALVEEPSSSAVEALSRAGVDPARVRQEVLQTLAGERVWTVSGVSS